MPENQPAKHGRIVSRYIFAVLGVIGVIAIVAQVLLLVYDRHPVRTTVSQCVLNLRAIDELKQQWMLENHKASHDTPTWSDLAPYAKAYGWTNEKPVCPQGGTYTINPMDELPNCSIGGPGHSIP